jgi:beta-glucanase (GH16 family)
MLAACAGETDAPGVTDAQPQAVSEINEDEGNVGEPGEEADPHAFVLIKRGFTYPTVSHINVPAAGNFPDSWLRRVDRQNSRSTRFSQTLDWSPPVARAFEPDTQYTAILTLSPVSNVNSFANTPLEEILGLPEENVVDISMEASEDDIIIRILFEATGPENVEPVLLFYDDFEGDSLDYTKWAYPPNWDRQGRGTWDSGMVSVGDGYLRLGFVRDAELGHRKTGNAADAENWLRSGAVRTMQLNHINTLFESTYGYFEASIKFPQVRGMWGAFWLMSPTLRDGARAEIGTEIDIVESIHNERGAYNSAIHWGGYGTGHRNRGSTRTPVDIYDGEFHTFALEWTPTEYIFFVDGEEFWRVSENINRNPNYVKLSVEGASWAGTLPEDFTEGEMLVDWVRVYNQPMSDYYGTN